MAIIIDNSVKNKKDTPSITSDVAANLPAATDVPVGAIYIETDTGTIKQSDGVTWQTLGGGGGPVPPLSSVLAVGNTATDNIVLNGAPGNGNLTADGIVSAGNGEVKLGKSTSGYVELRDATERKALLGDGATDIVKFRAYNGNSFVIDYDGTVEGNITTLISTQPLLDLNSTVGVNYVMYEARPTIDSKLPGPASDNCIGFYYDPLITNAANVTFIPIWTTKGYWFLSDNFGSITVGNGANVTIQDTINGKTGIYSADVINLFDGNTGQAIQINSSTGTYFYDNGTGDYQVNLTYNQLILRDAIGQAVNTTYANTGISVQDITGGKLLNLFFYDRSPVGYAYGDYYFQDQGAGNIEKTLDYQEKNAELYDYAAGGNYILSGVNTKTVWLYDTVGGSAIDIRLDATLIRPNVIYYLCVDHATTGNLAVVTVGTAGLLGATPINKSGMFMVTYNDTLDLFAISHV